jgi:hypothetical protein
MAKHVPDLNSPMNAPLGFAPLATAPADPIAEGLAKAEAALAAEQAAAAHKKA